MKKYISVAVVVFALQAHAEVKIFDYRDLSGFSPDAPFSLVIEPETGSEAYPGMMAAMEGVDFGEVDHQIVVFPYGVATVTEINAPENARLREDLYTLLTTAAHYFVHAQWNFRPREGTRATEFGWGGVSRLLSGFAVNSGRPTLIFDEPGTGNSKWHHLRNGVEPPASYKEFVEKARRLIRGERVPTSPKSRILPDSIIELGPEAEANTVHRVFTPEAENLNFFGPDKNLANWLRAVPSNAFIIFLEGPTDHKIPVTIWRMELMNRLEALWASAEERGIVLPPLAVLVPEYEDVPSNGFGRHERRGPELDVEGFRQSIQEHYGLAAAHLVVTLANLYTGYIDPLVQSSGNTTPNSGPTVLAEYGENIAQRKNVLAAWTRGTGEGERPVHPHIRFYREAMERAGGEALFVEGSDEEETMALLVNQIYDAALRFMTGQDHTLPRVTPEPESYEEDELPGALSLPNAGPIIDVVHEHFNEEDGAIFARLAAEIGYIGPRALVFTSFLLRLHRGKMPEAGPDGAGGGHGGAGM